jgi:hypothetical protein
MASPAKGFDSAQEPGRSLDEYRDALRRVDATLRAGGHPEWLHGVLAQQRSFLVAHVTSKEALMEEAVVSTDSTPGQG